MATLGVAMLVGKLRERSKARKMHLSRPQRLRELYPVTYAAIESQNKTNGQGSPTETTTGVK